MCKQQIDPEIKQKHIEMLYPTVRIVAKVKDKGAVGSGTIIYSGEHDDGVHTFVLTCHHVINDLISVTKEWDSSIGREKKTEKREKAQVETFTYNNYSNCIGTTGKRASIVAHQEDKDLALLELEDRENVQEYVANIFPYGQTDEIHLYDNSYAVGAAMGHPPIVTEGHIAFLNDRIEGEEFILSTAQSIFGNSGGALFRYSSIRNQYELIGLPARITVALSGFALDAITHMGYAVKIDSIFKFLDKNFYQFIYDESQTLEECKKKREKMLERERRRLLLEEGAVEDIE